MIYQRSKFEDFLNVKLNPVVRGRFEGPRFESWILLFLDITLNRIGAGAVSCISSSSIPFDHRSSYLDPFFITFDCRHYWKNSPVRSSCDLECRKRMICDLRSGRSHDRKSFCQEIESRIDANHPTGWKAWFYNGLALSYVISVSSFTWVTELSARSYDALNNCNLW